MKHIVVLCIILGVAFATPEQHVVFLEPVDLEISKETANFMKYLERFTEKDWYVFKRYFFIIA